MDKSFGGSETGESGGGIDPSSYSAQEIRGEPPTSIRLGAWRLHMVLGVPPATLGQDNEFALRADGTVAGNTVAYHKQGGVWVAFTTA